LVTNWPLLTATIAIDLALAKSAHTLLGEPERVLEKHHDRRVLARSNIEANEILPRLETLFASMTEWRGNNPAATPNDALLAVGYEPTMQELNTVYTEYVRLERLPQHIRRASVGVAILLVLLLIIVPVETTDVIYSGDVIPHWAEVTAAIIGLIALTLAVVAGVVYYHARDALTRLLEKHA
jgi:hypothetical protein